MSLSNASLLEICYVLLVIPGVICNAWCLWDAMKDRQAVQSMEHDDGLDYLISNANVRSEFVRLFVQSFFLMIGLMSLYLPPAAPPEYATDRQRLAWLWVISIRTGMFIVTGSLSLSSLMTLRERKRIIGWQRTREAARTDKVPIHHGE